METAYLDRIASGLMWVVMSVDYHTLLEPGPITLLRFRLVRLWEYC